MGYRGRVATGHLLLHLCSQRGFTAVLCSTVEGRLHLLRELVEQYGADLYHKANVSDSLCDSANDLLLSFFLTLSVFGIISCFTYA